MATFSNPSHATNRDPWLAALARQKRFSLTESEARLASALAGGRLGVYFRRQVPLLGRFIVDFLAPRLKLVVEVDGGCHRARRRADARRDEALRRAGYQVLRLDAELAIGDLPSAVARVAEEILRLR